MRFHRNNVTEARPLDFEEEISFKDFDFAPHYPLLGLKDVHAEGEFRVENKLLVAYLHLHFLATMSDARTCKPFEQEFDYEDEFALLQTIDDEGEGYVFEENNIELRDVAFCSIHTHIPMCPHAPGSELPESGEGYRVYSEEEFDQEPHSSPFDVLADYPVDK